MASAPPFAVSDLCLRYSLSAQKKQSNPAMEMGTAETIASSESTPQFGSNSENQGQIPAPDASSGEHLLLAAAEAESAEASMQHMPGIIDTGMQQIVAYQPDGDLSAAGGLRTQTSISDSAAAANEIKASWNKRPDPETQTSTAAPDTGFTVGGKADPQCAATESGITEGTASEKAPATQPNNSEAVPPDVVAYRRERFHAAINRSLGAAGVYTPVKLDSAQLSSDAEFTGSEWKITLSEGALACPAEGVSDVANSVYHEARHAEQKHLLMRMKAGELKSEPAYAIVATEASYISSLSAQYHVHKDAVNHAFQTPIATTHPLTPALTDLWNSMYDEAAKTNAKVNNFRDAARAFMDKTGTNEDVIDSAMMRSIMQLSTNAANRLDALTLRWFGSEEDALKAYEKYTEVKKELAELQLVISQAGMTFNEAYAQYRSRLYEQDAFAAGDAVQQAMDGDSATQS